MTANSRAGKRKPLRGLTDQTSGRAELHKARTLKLEAMAERPAYNLTDGEPAALRGHQHGTPVTRNLGLSVEGK